MNQGNWSYFVQRDLSEFFVLGYGKSKSMIPSLATQKTPNQAIVYEAIVGNMGSVPVFDGDVSYDDTKQSYRKSVEEVEYALGVKVTKKLRRNDLYGIVQIQVKELAGRFRARREAIFAAIFNGAFSTTTVADTLSLCNTAHTSDQGGTNQGNSGTSAISAANVEATRRLMIAFKDTRDNIIDGAFPDTIMVATAGEEAGMEIISSTGKVDGALNNPNFHKGKYNLLVYHNWLTDANNWFMINLDLLKDLLSFYEWNPVEFLYAGEFDTFTSKHAGYMSCNVSVKDWRAVYGHNVA